MPGPVESFIVGSKEAKHGKFKPGFDSGWHVHESEYTAVVLQGTMLETSKGSESAEPLGPGSYYRQSTVVHRTQCTGTTDCLAYIFEEGRFSFTPTTRTASPSHPARPSPPGSDPGRDCCRFEIRAIARVDSKAPDERLLPIQDPRAPLEPAAKPIQRGLLRNQDRGGRREPKLAPGGIAAESRWRLAAELESATKLAREGIAAESRWRLAAELESATIPPSLARGPGELESATIPARSHDGGGGSLERAVIACPRGEP